MVELVAVESAVAEQVELSVRFAIVVAVAAVLVEWHSDSRCHRAQD